MRADTAAASAWGVTRRGAPLAAPQIQLSFALDHSGLVSMTKAEARWDETVLVDVVAPKGKGAVAGVCVSVCLCLCVSVCVCVCLYVCVRVCVCVCVLR